MKVLKFGGTSVGTVNSLRHVKEIVESLDQPAVVVVSALGGLTDKLISTAKMAADNISDYSAEVDAMYQRHYDIINEMVDEEKRSETTAKVTELLNQLSDLYKGIYLIKDLPAKTLDVIVSYGERMSSIIVAAIIKDAAHYNSPDFIKTEQWFGKNIADRPLTERLIKETFSLPLEKTAILGGFISTDRDSGEITNLGRGGSDYTAALIAAALDAEILEIWTDVDGFMTADPRIIKNAKVIDRMTFIESMELCSFGAKVIYPPTIYPVFHKNIPIKILNTFNPTAPGTFIDDSNVESELVVRGVSSVKDISLVTIIGSIGMNVAAINSRTFNALARKGLNVFLVAQPDDTHDFSFAIRSEIEDETIKTLQEEFAPEFTDGALKEIKVKNSLSIVVMVKDGIKSIEGLGARSRNSLQRNGVKVEASSDGASETTIAHVVNAEDTQKTLSLMHDFCLRAI